MKIDLEVVAVMMQSVWDVQGAKIQALTEERDKFVALYEKYVGLHHELELRLEALKSIGETPQP